MTYSNVTIFFAELVGTFGLLVAATGSIVFDARMDGMYGMVFIALAHFIGLAILVSAFGKYSMAHFNPAVTLGFYLARYVPERRVPVYISAQLIGAFLGSLTVLYLIGNYANLGLNAPNYSYNIGIIFSVEIIATAFLMGGILIAVNIKRFTVPVVGVIVGGIIALDVFFLGPISGASMNPMRSLSPAVMTGLVEDLWLYWTAPFVGSGLAALIFRLKFPRRLKAA